MGVRSVNNSLQEFLDTFVRSGTDAATPYVAPAGLTATGGVISDYVEGSSVYRAHIFTSSGTFTVSALGTFGNTVDYLVVAGGGGGGSGQPGVPDNGGRGGGSGGPYAGGGNGESRDVTNAQNGLNNTGGGGGGASTNPGGSGGSGIVLIAYPS